MIIFTIYGLDQFVVSDYSKEHTNNLANLFECKEEEIIFVAPNTYVFHKGVEQTSWNPIIKVECDEKYHAIEDKVVKYFEATLKDVELTINVHVIFEHLHEHHVHSIFNDKYPKFMEENNMVNIENEDLENVDITDEDQVYTGNIFKDFDSHHHHDK